MPRLCPLVLPTLRHQSTLLRVGCLFADARPRVPATGRGRPCATGTTRTSRRATWRDLGVRRPHLSGCFPCALPRTPPPLPGSLTCSSRRASMASLQVMKYGFMSRMSWRSFCGGRGSGCQARPHRHFPGAAGLALGWLCRKGLALRSGSIPSHPQDGPRAEGSSSAQVPTTAARPGRTPRPHRPQLLYPTGGSEQLPPPAPVAKDPASAPPL